MWAVNGKLQFILSIQSFCGNEDKDNFGHLTIFIFTFILILLVSLLRSTQNISGFVVSFKVDCDCQKKEIVWKFHFEFIFVSIIFSYQHYDGLALVPKVVFLVFLPVLPIFASSFTRFTLGVQKRSIMNIPHGD